MIVGKFTCVVSPSALNDAISSAPRIVLPSAALAVGAVLCRLRACTEYFPCTFTSQVQISLSACIQDWPGDHGRDKSF